MGKRDRRSTSLYGGEAGSYAAQQDPAAYLGAFGNLGGFGGSSGTPYQTWFNDVFSQDVYRDYLGQLARSGKRAGEKLTFADYVKNQYGAKFGGQQGQRMKSGRLGREAATAFRDYNYETNPQSAYDVMRSKQGMLGSITGTGMNREAQDFVRSQGYLTDRTAFEGVRAKAPNLTWGDWTGLTSKKKRRRR
jgi:hypothetical protein